MVEELTDVDRDSKHVVSIEHVDFVDWKDFEQEVLIHVPSFPYWYHSDVNA